mgnify:CR=1 FL=1
MSVSAAPWLDSSQNATVTLAISLADAIDADRELMTDARLLAQFRGLLEDLGLTVESRPEPRVLSEEVDWVEQVKETAARGIDSASGNAKAKRPVRGS